MQKLFGAALCATILTLGAAPQAQAGAVERACRKAQPGKGQVCSCIGDVAKASLSRSDQRKVAKFFSDPDLAQEMRQSSKRSDEALWLRYKAFGAQAQQRCS